MKTVDDYFLKRTDKVSFVQLKKGTSIDVGDYTIKDYIPLPIETTTLVKEIKEGNIEEELKVPHIIDGAIYILGIDRDFKYKMEYRKILYNYNPKIEEYILFKAFKLIKEDNLEDGTIFFRALTGLNPKNTDGLFNYALSLENIAKDFINSNQKEKGETFLIDSTNQLETILDIDDGYVLAYYKLGYHYKYYEQFQKAKLIWEKYMKLDRDHERLQEIREELELIDDDAKFEEGVNYLTHGQYEKALDRLMPLSYKYKEWWNIFYLIGLAYKGLGEYEEAIDFFYEAIDLDEVHINLYNELGICLFGLGDIMEAINIFTQGIEQDDTDYRIIFNRGLAYLKLGIIDKAKEDIEVAYRLNPNDRVVKNQLEELENYY
ncbi:tetratricopeptide repeat protein [Schnuerera ultunensis]|uniref:Uncharacterized protein n=1 Tax=[Clostridium] ultunense Esp TaxID=1288971 RepID=A0A1M4PSI4_9FIRM|nr:tetratricopeptide repeat protein [Schnuerera ultunensis]SHD78513.1 conserved protein of unknown function [[Clostridium] ultunense Esp]